MSSESRDKVDTQKPGPLPGVELAVERERKKQQRLFALSVLIMIGAIAAAVGFAYYGRSDVEALRGQAKAEVEDVFEEAGESTQSVRETLPRLREAAKAAEALENLEWKGEKRRLDEVLEAVEEEQNSLVGANASLRAAQAELEDKVSRAPMGEKLEKELEKVRMESAAVTATLRRERAQLEKDLRTENAKVAEGWGEQAKRTAVLQAEQAKLKADNEKLLKEMEAEREKHRRMIEALQERQQRLSEDLEKRLKRLEARRPVGRFDGDWWQSEIKLRMVAYGRNDAARGRTLMAALRDHSPYSARGTKSTEDSLKALDAKLGPVR